MKLNIKIIYSRYHYFKILWRELIEKIISNKKLLKILGTAKSSRRNRFGYLTALRGIAALGVVGGHVIGMVPPDHKYENIFLATNSQRVIWPLLFGGEMVWLFLFISGFSLFYSENRRRAKAKSSKWKSYFLRRTVRIAPTYYFGLLLGLLILVLGRGISVEPSPSLNTSTPITIIGVVSHLFFIHNFNPDWVHQVNPPLWTIGVELQLYLLLPLFFVKYFRNRLFLTSILIVLVAKIIHRTTSLPLFYFVEWFVAGILVSAIVSRYLISSKLTLPAVIIFGFLSLSRVLISYTQLYVMCWVIFIAFLVIFLHNAQPKRMIIPFYLLLKNIGKVSYSLYVVHFPISLLCWWFVSNFSNDRTVLIFAMMAISLPAIALFTLISYKFIELPSLRLMSKIV